MAASEELCNMAGTNNDRLDKYVEDSIDYIANKARSSRYESVAREWKK